MFKSVGVALPEVFLSTRETSNWVSDQLAFGRIRKIGPRLYTTNMLDEPRALIRRHIWEIVGMYCPGGLIADRTALESTPAKDGSVFVISKRTTIVELDGLRIVPRKGYGPTELDRPFMGTRRV